MAPELIDIRRAAGLVGRHPETVRRWVWSGRLAARREGNRLLVERGDVEALAGHHAPKGSLAAWVREAEQALVAFGTAGSGRSAADLVIADRQSR